MNDNVIEVGCSGRTLTFENMPVTPSGSQNDMKIKFWFYSPGSWYGMVKVCSFYSEKGKYYYAHLNSADEVIIPTGALARDGHLTFALAGFNGITGVTQTTDTLTMDVAEGAYTAVDPTEAATILEQIMQQYSELADNLAYIRLNPADDQYAYRPTEKVHTGTVMWYASGIAPEGWLVCNGQAVSRQTYARLFSVIGTTYGSGNGSTTFNVPDLQGLFIRGYNGSGNGIDSGRTFGSLQEGTTFDVHAYGEGGTNGTLRYGHNGDDYGTQQASQVEGTNTHVATTDTITVRPSNIALLPIIKY